MRPADRDRPVCRFSEDDVAAASIGWNANCGPVALAAALGLTPIDIRPHLVGFEAKGYTNPTLMFSALRSLDVTWVRGNFEKSANGRALVRVQWEGPWTEPGVPMRARYRQTHWIAVHRASPVRCWVFDVNSAADGWIPFRWWETRVVPAILRACVPKAYGTYHTTHWLKIIEPRFG